MPRAVPERAALRNAPHMVSLPECGAVGIEVGHGVCMIVQAQPPAAHACFKAQSPRGAVQLDLPGEETLALLNLLIEGPSSRSLTPRCSLPQLPGSHGGAT